MLDSRFKISESPGTVIREANINSSDAYNVVPDLKNAIANDMLALANSE